MEYSAMLLLSRRLVALHRLESVCAPQLSRALFLDGAITARRRERRCDIPYVFRGCISVFLAAASMSGKRGKPDPADL